MNLNDLYTVGISLLGKLFVAVIILLIGLRLIKLLVKFLVSKLDKPNIDPSLRSFLISLTRTSLYIFLGVMIASILGVEMTSFVALLASIGFTVGLALQGSLSNFAGGVLLLLLRPFKVGDFIESGDRSGTVEAIQIFYTILKTPDNQQITIPNADLSSRDIVNYSAKDTRRLHLTVSAGYEDDIQTVKSILQKIADEHPLVLKDPAPKTVLAEHGDNSLNYYIFAWTKTSDYWDARFDILEKIKTEFDKASINIPYPQMDVHMDKHENSD